ncbi:hypothetical protein BO83DRAFT_41451 [Aspergillus eucalypticola CBS 122712]|uniref:Uncharacterized protein n=1 Tax=Aspergillus eucalypticola (strain CBS 122712 / IBT 29274) TaxID=1448314 RepID=A0A317VLT1_ASPEC|nr:uncharacterized protein BO83DRAFT_41451 [Aspergillus eucalypticola CBS 122712]PWY72860.1 hypothetical protein BO83DRAFT_41451 [Aspergillus eucalypticola CBS 122712]
MTSLGGWGSGFGLLLLLSGGAVGSFFVLFCFFVLLINYKVFLLVRSDDWVLYFIVEVW